jgi:hypothetical protein
LLGDEIKEGSITIEAAYIVPIIIGIIFAIMTISFYFYDMSAVQSVLNQNVYKFEKILFHPCDESLDFQYSAINKRFLYSINRDYSEWEVKCRETIEEELGKSLMLLNVDNVKVEIGKKKVTAEAEISYMKNIPFAADYIPFLKTTKKLTSEDTVYNKADFVRLVDIIKGGKVFGGKS